MATLQEILARAQALREETELGSISPERAGSIMYDTLQQINQMQLLGASLVINKIYASVAAMEADSAPVSDLSGTALKEGQLVVIVPSDTSSSDMGSVYRYNGTTDGVSSWSFVGKIGGYPMDETPTEGSTRAVTSGGVYSKVSQLAQEATDLREDVGERDTTTIRHDIALPANFINSGKAIYATGANIGQSYASSSNSTTAYVDVSAYKGKTLIYTRPKTTSASPAFGLCFFTGTTESTVISGETAIGGADAVGYEEAEIIIPATANYVRFTFRTEFLSNFYAYVNEVVDNGFQNGLGKSVQDLQAEMVKLDEAGVLPKRIFYRIGSAGNNHNYRVCFVLTQVEETTYLRWRIGLYNVSASGPTSKANTMWRLEDVVFGSYDVDTKTFSADASAKLLTNGENEFVIRQTSPAKVDFTGGYHGDEYIYDENGDAINGTFAQFFINGEAVSADTDTPGGYTEIQSFYYKQRSAMYETANTGADQTNVGRLIAYHEKTTEISSNGYKTTNRIDLVENIPFYAFGGISCVERYVSEYAMGEGDELTAMGTGTPAIAEEFSNYGNSLITYQGGGYEVRLRSNVIFGDDNAEQRLYVSNNTQYNKFYRQSQTLTDATKFKAECELRLHKL